jgi:hypothetical protein
MGAFMELLKDRLERDTNMSGPVVRVELGECWEWTGCRLPKGYGMFTIQGQTVYAHRVAWEIATGLSADTLCVCHRCDNPPCVRPDHLFIGTHRDNALDCKAKGRHRNGVLFGDANGSRKHPERLARGDLSPARLYPERLCRGDRHWTKRDPERAARVARANLLRDRAGEANGRAKLTVGIVLELRRAYAAGDIDYAQAAIKYGVSVSTVRQAANGRKWRHVSSVAQ